MKIHNPRFYFYFLFKINRVSIKIMRSWAFCKLNFIHWPKSSFSSFAYCSEFEVLIEQMLQNMKHNSDVFLWWNTNQINKHILTVFSRNVFKFRWMTKKLHDFEMLTDKERFQTKEKHLSHIASSGLEMCFGLTSYKKRLMRWRGPFL